jgi:Family of unknown function (DUF5994)
MTVHRWWTARTTVAVVPTMGTSTTAGARTLRRMLLWSPVLEVHPFIEHRGISPAVGRSLHPNAGTPGERSCRDDPDNRSAGSTGGRLGGRFDANGCFHDLAVLDAYGGALVTGQDGNRRNELATSSMVGARLDFRSDRSVHTLMDGAWWPRSGDAATELVGLVQALDARQTQVTLIMLNPRRWQSHPRRIEVAGRTVRVGWFLDLDKATLIATTIGHRRIDLLVIADETLSGAHT